MLLRRPIVAQPPPPQGGAPLPVGIVPFTAPEPRLAIVLKCTLALDVAADGSKLFSRALMQEPLTRATPSTQAGAAEGELARPCDFVPRKTALDVFVTGHAHTRRPSSRIVVLASVGSVAMDMNAVASEAVKQIPLTAPYLRGADGVSPIASIAPRRTRAVLDRHEADFDWAAYQAAPRAQQSRLLQPGESFRVRGLFPTEEDVLVRLPDWSPRAALVSAHEGIVEVALRCDTLILDADEERCLLVFRGDVALLPPNLFDLRYVTVWLDEKGQTRAFAEIRRELPRGAFAFADAAEEHAAAGSLGDPVELELVRYGTYNEKPEPKLSLADYARISAELAEGRWKREDVLERHQLSEEHYLLEERAWLEIMADQAVQGDAMVASQYGELFIAAQDDLAEPREAERSVDEYVDRKAEIEVKGEPARVLEEHGERLAPWMRWDRRMTRAALADAALAAEIEQKLELARRRYELAMEQSEEALRDEHEEEEA